MARHAIRRRGYAAPTRFAAAWSSLRARGIFHSCGQAGLWMTWPLWHLYFRARPRWFSFQNRHYPYFLHSYNFTWSNERAVEVPIVWSHVQQHTGRRILEVGNVLSHYYSIAHEVVDKFERGRAISNVDVLEIRAPNKYSLIVSISTLEHVGWDERPRDPDKLVRAIEHLADLLESPGGRLVVTVPLGYNPHLDRLLAEARLPFSRTHYLRRSGMSSWQEADWNQVAGTAYGTPWPSANALAIGVVER